MYIRGLIPRNFAELAESVPIEINRLSEAVPMRPFFRAKNGGKLRQIYPQPRE